MGSRQETIIRSIFQTRLLDIAVNNRLKWRDRSQGVFGVSDATEVRVDSLTQKLTWSLLRN
jgi:hypothetical protein